MSSPHGACERGSGTNVSSTWRKYDSVTRSIYRLGRPLTNSTTNDADRPGRWALLLVGVVWGNECVLSTLADETVGRLRWLRITAAVVALAAVCAAATTLVAQIDVASESVGSRACGSAFDGIVDREGWQTWWAGDLDEPDDSARSALVRTTLCPDAVNNRIRIAGVFGGVALLAAVLTWALHPERSDVESRDGGRARLRRLGAASTAAGALLTGAGLIGVIVLVADRESTLFLYTDRLVVGIVGLVVLIPPMALIVIGRALSIASSHPDAPMGQKREEAAQGDPP